MKRGPGIRFSRSGLHIYDNEDIQIVYKPRCLPFWVTHIKIAKKTGAPPQYSRFSCSLSEVRIIGYSSFIMCLIAIIGCTSIILGPTYLITSLILCRYSGE